MVFIKNKKFIPDKQFVRGSWTQEDHSSYLSFVCQSALWPVSTQLISVPQFQCYSLLHTPSHNSLYQRSQEIITLWRLAGNNWTTASDDRTLVYGHCRHFCRLINLQVFYSASLLFADLTWNNDSTLDGTRVNFPWQNQTDLLLPPPLPSWQ